MSSAVAKGRRKAVSSTSLRVTIDFLPVAAETISFRRILRRNPLAGIGLLFVVLLAICAIFAPWLAPQDPAHIQLASRLAHPSWSQLFGSDELGRDIFSHVVYGSRTSLLLGSCVVAASLGIGLIHASIPGYSGGAIDRFVNIALMDAFMPFPGILVAIAFV